MTESRARELAIRWKFLMNEAVFCSDGGCPGCSVKSIAEAQTLKQEIEQAGFDLVNLVVSPKALVV